MRLRSENHRIACFDLKIEIILVGELIQYLLQFLPFASLCFKAFLRLEKWLGPSKYVILISSFKHKLYNKLHTFKMMIINLELETRFP